MLSLLRLALWTIFWLLLWPPMQFFRKKGQHNCVTWAINEWDTKEGYIVIRWCRSSKFKWLRWPHFLFLDQEHFKHVRHFVPNNRAKVKNEIVPALWFDGHEKQGDPPDRADEN